jgi:hypothetical protein
MSALLISSQFHRMRKRGWIGALSFVFLGSFFLTLWLTKPGAPPDTAAERPAADQLAGHAIANASDLLEAAKEVGLHYSSNRMQGLIESMSRVDEREVKIGGWLADPQADATPLTLLVFLGGKRVAATETRGERPDVTNKLGLAFGSERNVAFSVSFGCRPGDQAIVVGLGRDSQFLALSLPACP